MTSISEEETYGDRMPSLEVEFVWRVHMLNPQNYVADCMSRFGRVIPHKCNDQRPQFELQVIDSDSIQSDSIQNRTGPLGGSLFMPSAIKRRCRFIDKILSVEHITSDALDGAIDRYEQFLHLTWAPDKPEGLSIVPTDDIDLIWHSHQLDPTGYYSFCIENSPNGELLVRDDNVNASTSFWKKTFGWTAESFWNSKYGKGTYANGQHFVVTKQREPQRYGPDKKVIIGIGGSCGAVAGYFGGVFALGSYMFYDAAGGIGSVVGGIIGSAIGNVVGSVHDQIFPGTSEPSKQRDRPNAPECQ